MLNHYENVTLFVTLVMHAQMRSEHPVPPLLLLLLLLLDFVRVLEGVVRYFTLFRWRYRAAVSALLSWCVA